MTTTEGHRGPLPATVLPVPNESAPAYLARLDRANGGTKRLHAHVDFLGPTNLEAWHDVGATSSTFELAAHLTGIPADRLVTTLKVRLLAEQIDGRPRLAGSQIPRPLVPIERLRACSACTHTVPHLRLQAWTEPTAFTCPIHHTLLTGSAARVDADILLAQNRLRRMWACRSRAGMRSAIEDAWNVVNGWTGPVGDLKVASAWRRREEAAGVWGRDALLLRTPEVVAVALAIMAHADTGTRHNDHLHGTFERITYQALKTQTTRRWLAADATM